MKGVSSNCHMFQIPQQNMLKNLCFMMYHAVIRFVGINVISSHCKNLDLFLSKFLHGVWNIMSHAFKIWFLFFLMTWNVYAVTVFVIFYMQTYIWNVLAYETAHHTKFQVPCYNGSSFVIQLRNCMYSLYI